MTMADIDNILSVEIVDFFGRIKLLPQINYPAICGESGNKFCSLNLCQN